MPSDSGSLLPLLHQVCVLCLGNQTVDGAAGAFRTAQIHRRIMHRHAYHNAFVVKNGRGNFF